MTGLRRAMARFPLASTRCSCVCVAFRHSLVSLSGDTEATQQWSAMAGGMNGVFWRCCLEFLVWLGGRLKDGKNVGELVVPRPQRTESSHGIKVCVQIPVPNGLYIHHSHWSCPWLSKDSKFSYHRRQDASDSIFHMHLPLPRSAVGGMYIPE